ncbi:unnamed protein product [Calypogeia fissa]
MRLTTPLHHHHQHHRAVAAWPWVDPAVDVVQKPRQSSEQSSSRSVKLKLDLPNLLSRGPADDVDRQQDDQSARRKAWLPGAPPVSQPRAVHNAAALAYMGDAIFELYVRRHFLTPPQSMEKYNQRVTALVCCEAQHALLQKLVKQDVLTEEERDVLRWGRNVDAGNKTARRRAGGSVYNSASSLETLIGYLYLTNVERLQEVIELMGFTSDDKSLEEIS